MHYWKCILTSLLILFSPLSGGENYTLSICALFRNEARFLKEWIEYHRIVGVEHFYLFNHLSEDDWQEVLAPYIDEGIVEVEEWPYLFRTHVEWILDVQTKAYGKIASLKKEESKWIAFIDTDEFIVPVCCDDLREILQEYEEFAGLHINWQIYGTSDVDEIPEDQTMIGTLLRKAEESYRENRYIKTISQPKYIEQIKDAHFPIYLPGFEAITENGQSRNWQQTSRVSIEKIRINHYTNRDEKFYWSQKLPRNRRLYPRISPTLAPNQKYNREYDPIMLRFVPELERRLFETN